MRRRVLIGLSIVHAGGALLWWAAARLNRELLPARVVVPAWDERVVTWPAWGAVAVVTLVVLTRMGMIAARERTPAQPVPQDKPGFELPAVTSWRDPIYLGNDVSGAPVHVATWNIPQWLIGGTSGSGKTVAMRMILAHYALDPDAILWGIDGKGNRDDWAGMRSRFDRWVSATDRVNGAANYLQMLEDLGHLIDERQDISGRDYPGMLVLMDDAPQLRRRLDKAGKAKADDLLTGIVQTCRAVNIMVLTTTQRPSAKQLDTDQRAQAGIALCMQMDSLDDARMALGVRPEDDAILTFPIGHGLLKAERGKPREVAIHHLTDAMWAKLGQRFTPVAAPLPSNTYPQDEPDDLVYTALELAHPDPLYAASLALVEASHMQRLTTEAILAGLPSHLAPPDAGRLGRALSANGWLPRIERIGEKTARFRYAEDAPLRQDPKSLV